MKSKEGICIMNVNFAGNKHSDLGINKTDATKAKPDNRKYEPQNQIIKIWKKDLMRLVHKVEQVLILTANRLLKNDAKKPLLC